MVFGRKKEEKETKEKPTPAGEKMAKTSAPEKSTKPSAPSTPPANQPPAAPPAAAGDQPAADAGQQQKRQQTITLDDRQISVAYANFCRVSGTPEELIVDFGLNNDPTGATNQPITMNQRVVINYFTAKRLLSALSVSVQRHEAAFGALETDVRKRVIQPETAAPAAAAIDAPAETPA